jgi:glycosyltransferase involved in cell wall biosynthesis
MKGTTMSALSIVLPAYNEERNLPGCMGSLRETFAGTDYEVLIVDDGSSDGTLAEARRLAAEDPARVTVLAHDRNRGMGAALRTGYEAARGDYVTYCPADFAMSAADWASFAAALGRADVLVGRRLRREGYSPLMRFNSWLYLRLVRLLFGLHLRDVAWISVYRRDLVRQVTITQQGFAMLVEIIVKLRDLGASFREVDCRMQRRTIGTPSSARFSVMWRTLTGVLGFWWTYRRVSPAPTPRPVPTDAPGATPS